MSLNFGAGNLFKNRIELGEGLPGLDALSEDQRRISSVSSGSDTDADVFTTATKIAESAKNLDPGTYIIFATINGDIFRDVAGAGWGTMKIWLQHGSTEITGSRTKQALEVPDNSEKSVSLSTGGIYAFDGTEKISLYAQAIDGGEQTFIHDNHLTWVKISSDY